MWLVDLNYNFECDWLIELSDNKMTANNSANELVENWSFLKPKIIEEIEIFIINLYIAAFQNFKIPSSCNMLTGCESIATEK